MKGHVWPREQEVGLLGHESAVCLLESIKYFRTERCHKLNAFIVPDHFSKGDIRDEFYLKILCFRPADLASYCGSMFLPPGGSKDFALNCCKGSSDAGY